MDSSISAATEVQDALLCPSCSLGPVFNNEQITLSCVTCNHTLSKRELDERQRVRCVLFFVGCLVVWDAKCSSCGSVLYV